MTTLSSDGGTTVPKDKSNTPNNLESAKKRHDEFRKKFDDKKVFISLELAKRDKGFLNILVSKLLKYDDFEDTDDRSFGELTIQSMDIEWEIYNNNDNSSSALKKDLEMSIHRTF